MIANLMSTLRIVAVAAFLLAGSSHPAAALPNYPNDVAARYPNSPDLATCGLCHFSFTSGSNLNPYGDAFKDANGTRDPNAGMAAIEGGDPDGDDFVSLTEIDAGFFPGYNCMNYTRATNVPPGLALELLSDPGNIGCGVGGTPDINVLPISHPRFRRGQRRCDGDAHSHDRESGER